MFATDDFLTQKQIDWLLDQVDAMPHSIARETPVAFNEAHRFLPVGVSPRPGYIRYDLFPYLIEPLDCFDVASDVREVNFMKGVQVGFTTLLESILFYYMAHVKTHPLMYITADQELATDRIENNIIPMINESGYSDLIRSADADNTRKTGKTKKLIQWEGGGRLISSGALNAAKMRQYSVPVMLKDEIDGWKRIVGKDGNSDKLTDARLSAYWLVRKILRGSTPLLAPSLIQEAYARGDQRKYNILCRACSFPQHLDMRHKDENGTVTGGFEWETEKRMLILESVRYKCCNCGHEHFETDKEFIFAQKNGAHWKPTATPREYGIRSYHLPSFYSPYDFRPWSKCIADFLDGFDQEENQVRDIGAYQEYYNNTLGLPFRPLGSSIRFTAVSAHRRHCYTMGNIPNEYAKKHSGSPVLLITCQVDVHKSNLAVSVKGWCKESKPYLIDYWRFEAGKDEDDCTELSCPVWARLRELIEEKVYEADDGKKYRVAITLIDSGYANDTVIRFCSDYASGVYPIVGRDRTAKYQKITEFAEFKTQVGTIGYRISVDLYKDRLAPVLRREWNEDMGPQREYHFNAPVDTTDKQLMELTKETRTEVTDDKGNPHYEWKRKGNAKNELWDLLVYGSAAVEILAYSICIKQFELESVDWPRFWDYVESEKLFFED